MMNEPMLPASQASYTKPKATERKFSWPVTQERLDMAFSAFHKLMTILDIAQPGSLAAENVACLMTDLRAHCCQQGAEDPFPLMPMAPRFADTVVTAFPSSIWGEEESPQ